MALNDSDLEGFTLSTERKPEKAGGVTVSQIPATLVSLLTAEAPKALADKDYELILTVPVRVAAPEALPEGATKEQQAAFKEASEAHAAAVKTAEGVAKQLALYAAAWGKGQTPKLYIHKVQNRKDMPTNVARLSVALDSEVPAENRPGRR